MGSTNSVHPYCKLATQAMQTTPMTSCTHGFASADAEEGEFTFALILVLLDRLTRTRKLNSGNYVGKISGRYVGFLSARSQGHGAFVCSHASPPQTCPNPPRF